MLKYILLTIFGFFILACSNDTINSKQVDAKTLSITKAPDNTSPISIFQILSITVSAKIASSSVSDTTVLLKDSSGNLVGASVELISPVNTKIILTPYTYLKPSSTYTLEVTTDIKSETGLSLSKNFEQIFTTQSAIVDTNPPTFKTFKPSSGAEIYSSTKMSVEFNKFIAPVSSSTKIIDVTCAGNSIDGSVEFFNSSITFTPTYTLNIGTPCNFKMLNGITDMYGNAYDLSTNNISVDANVSISENLGYKKLITLSTGKTSSLIRTMPVVGNDQRVVVIARSGGLDFYEVNSNVGSNYTPTLTFFYSYAIPSQINDIKVIDNNHIVIGTMSDGIYIFEIDSFGDLILNAHNTISEAIYGVSGGYNTSSGVLEKIYAVGPDYGLGVFDLNTSTYTLTLLSQATKANSAYLDVLQSVDKTISTPYTSELFVVDYNNGVVMYDTNGANPINIDLNGSYKNILTDYNYLTGDINYMKVTGSIGIGTKINFTTGNLIDNNYMNLPAAALDISSDYQSDLSCSRNIYSMGIDGLFMADKSNLKFHLTTGGNIVSATHVYRGLSANSQLYYLVTLDLDGTINIFNAVSDTTAPTSTANTSSPNIIITYNKILDRDSFNASDFVYTDNNVSINVTLSVVYTAISTEITVTPDTCNYLPCIVTTSTRISDLIGNQATSYSYTFSGA